METWAPIIAFFIVFIPAMFALWVQHKAYSEAIEDQREISQEMELAERKKQERDKKRGIL